MKFILILAAAVYSQGTVSTIESASSSTIGTTTETAVATSTTATAIPTQTASATVIKSAPSSTVTLIPSSVSFPPLTSSSETTLPLGTKFAIGAGIIFGIVFIFFLGSFIFTKLYPETSIKAFSAPSSKGTLTRPEFAVFTMWRKTFDRNNSFLPTHVYEQPRVDPVQQQVDRSLEFPELILPPVVAKRSTEMYKAEVSVDQSIVNVEQVYDSSYNPQSLYQQPPGRDEIIYYENYISYPDGSDIPRVQTNIVENHCEKGHLTTPQVAQLARHPIIDRESEQT